MNARYLKLVADVQMLHIEQLERAVREQQLELEMQKGTLEMLRTKVRCMETQQAIAEDRRELGLLA